MASRTLYWVGGTGLWSDPSHWSLSSGGAGGEAVPDSDDDVICDVNSSAVSYYIDASGLTTAFRNFSIAAKPATGDVTFYASNRSDISGVVDVAVTVGAGSSLTQTAYFYGTSSVKLPVGMYLSRTLYISSGTLTFQSDIQMLLNWSSTFQMVAGAAVAANSKKLTMYSDPATARGVYGGPTLHDLEIIGNGYFNFTANTTLTGTLTVGGLAANNRILIGSGTLGTSKTITAAAVALGHVDFMDIVGAGAATWAGAEVTGTEMLTNGDFGAGATGWSVSNADATHIATFSAGTLRYQSDTTTPNMLVWQNAGLTVGKTYQITTVCSAYTSGSLKIDATPAALVIAQAAGTTRVTFTAVSAVLNIYRNATNTDLTLDSVSIKEVSALGDCLGNSGIAFPTGVTQYWKTPTTGTKSWSAAANWFLATNGGGGAGRVPLPQDNVVFDANSIGATGVAITSDMPRLGKDISFAGVTNAPTWNVSSGNMYVFGSITAPSGMTMSIGATLLLSGRSSHTLNILATPVGAGTLYVYSAGGTYSLAAPLTHNGPLNLYTGAFVDAGYSVTSSAFDSSNSFARTLNATGSWTVTGAGSCWNLTTTTNLTVTALPSQVKFTDTSQSAKVFAGGSKTYGNVWFASATRFQITGSNNYADFKADPGAIITVNNGSAQTAATYHIDGRPSTGVDSACVFQDGSANGSMTTPYKAGAVLSGDMSVISKVKLASLASGAYQAFVCNQTAITANWAFYLHATTGKIHYTFYVGGAGIANGSTVTLASVGLVAGQEFWLGAYHDVNNGAGNNEVIYFWSLDKVTWNQLGGVLTTAGTVVRDTNALPFEAGSNAGGVNSLVGNHFKSEVYSGNYFTGAGTLVLDMDPARYPGTGNTFTASTGEVWTRNGNAQFTGTNLVTIAGMTNASYTLAVTGAAWEPKFVSYRNVTFTAAKNTSHFSLDGGGTTNITFTPARYAVAASASVNWNTTASWALGSGGASGAAIPTATEDVCFDSKTYPTAYTFTVDATANCNQLQFGAAPATSGTVTFAGASNINVYGSLLMLSGMAVTFSGNFAFLSTASGKTITSNGASLYTAASVNWSGTGGGWQLQDAFIGSALVINAGALDLNGKAFTGNYFDTNVGAITRSLTAGASAITLNGGGNVWRVRGTGVTMSIAFATINITAAGLFTAGGASYGTINYSMATVNNNIVDTLSCVNLSITGRANKTDPAMQFGGAVTVTGTLTVTGNSATNRVMVQSDTRGTSRTITAGAVSLTNANVMDIAGAGTANWSAVLGSEGVTNGAFTSDVSGWSNYGSGGTISWDAAGALKVLNDGSGAVQCVAGQPITCVIGKRYTVTALHVASSLVNGYLQIGTATSNANTANVVSPGVGNSWNFSFTATQTTHYLRLANGNVTANAYQIFDNVSVKPAIDATSIGDCLGNSGITFTPAADQYWYTTTTGNKTWGTVGNWFLGSGGTGGAGRVPLPQDSVVINSASVAAGAGGSTLIQVDMPHMCKDLTMTAMSNPPTIDANVYGEAIYGSLSLPAFSGGAYFNTAYGMTFYARSSASLTSGGNTIGGQLTLTGFGGTFSLQDDIALGTFALTAGTLNTNSHNITCSVRFSVTGGTLNAGASNINVAASNSTPFAVAVHTGGVWNAGTSTLKVGSSGVGVKVVQLSGGSYNNLWLSGAGAGPFQLTGNNTFNDFKADPGAIIQGTAGSVQTAATWHIDGAAASGLDAAYVFMDGVSGSGLSLPRTVGNTITGDLSAVVCVAPNSVAPTVYNVLMCQASTGAGKYNWAFYQAIPTATGLLQFSYTTDGVTPVTKQSSATLASVGLAAGQKFYLGVFHDIDNGAGGNDVYFYWSTDPACLTDYTKWTQLGLKQTTAGVVSRYASTAPIEAFSYNGYTLPLAGRGFRAKMYSGNFFSVGGATVIADCDPSLYPGAGDTVPDGADSTKNWTRAGNAQFTATNLTTVSGITNAAYTMAKSGGGFADFNYISLRNSTASPDYALRATSYVNGGNNTKWGWSVGLAGSPVSAVEGSLGPTITASIAGGSVTVNEGIVGIGIGLTGAAAYTQSSISVPTTRVPLLGNAMSGIAGNTLYPSMEVGISAGEASYAVQGVTYPSISKVLSGVSVSTVEGACLPAFSIPLAGEAAQLSFNDPLASFAIPLTGRSIVAVAGHLEPYRYNRDTIRVLTKVERIRVLGKTSYIRVNT